MTMTTATPTKVLGYADLAYPLIPFRHKYLITQLARRDVLARYKGSVLGVGWGLLFPLLILMAYTFVFRTVFKARWPGGGDSTTEFALQVFTGLVVFNLFSDLINRAPRLVLEQPNLVKRVVFPLEVLPWVALCSGVFHALLGLIILLLAMMTVGPGLTPWALVIPLIFMATVPTLLGIAWLLSALGVFIRDVSHATGPGVTMLMFLSPVLYPAEALPSHFRGMLWLNPLTLPIESLRNVLLKNQPPQWDALAIYTLVGMIFAYLAYRFFNRLRPAFSDEV